MLSDKCIPSLKFQLPFLSSEEQVYQFSKVMSDKLFGRMEEGEKKRMNCGLISSISTQYNPQDILLLNVGPSLKDSWQIKSERE